MSNFPNSVQHKNRTKILFSHVTFIMNYFHNKGVIDAILNKEKTASTFSILI